MGYLNDGMEPELYNELYNYQHLIPLKTTELREMRKMVLPCFSVYLSSQFLEIQALRSVPAFWSLKICKPSGVRSECVVSFFYWNLKRKRRQSKK
uniref:Uncharacterized protein n=1 Tax=Ditylenchus dipsaci TaxID=166011 RepID=A0A915E4X9_9BILA